MKSPRSPAFLIAALAFGSGTMGCHMATGHVFKRADMAPPGIGAEARERREAAVAPAAPTPATPAGNAADIAFAPGLEAAAADDPESVARKVVYTARVGLVVTDLEPAIAEARKLCEAAGGYVQEQTRGRTVLRVPAPRFRDVLAAVEGLGTVSDREVRAQDVTDEYVDLEARLRNAQAVAARLREMLAQAKDVKEALEVEKELQRVGEEIERIEGRLQLLARQVALSTITVEFHTKTPVPAEMEPKIRLPFAWLRDMELTALVELASRRTP